MYIPYPVRLAFQSLFREKWINLLSVVTIAIVLCIMSLAFMFVYNLDLMTQKLPEKFSVILYLEDNLQGDKVQDIIRSLKRKKSVQAVRYIPKEDALKELRSTLKNSQYILEGLDENPLPDTLELKMRKDAVGPESVKKLSDELMKIKGIHEVDYGVKFLSTIHSLKTGLKTLGMFFLVILSIGVVFVCYSTVKILFYRKNEEIETFKLLGAGKAFISAPFLIEGSLLGAAGGFFSLLTLVAFYNFVLLRLIIALPVFKTVLFPASYFIMLPAIGLFLGITGAFIALGRLKY